MKRPRRCSGEVEFIHEEKLTIAGFGGRSGEVGLKSIEVSRRRGKEPLRLRKGKE